MQPQPKRGIDHLTLSNRRAVIALPDFMTPNSVPFSSLRDYLAQISAMQAPPLSASGMFSPPPDIGTHARVLQLQTQDDWDRFHRAYTGGRQGNLKPWFRCLSILRSLGARTAVSESYYVCLDYRSEFASFYAHIDAPRRSSTTRLHFFREDIAEDAIINLTKAQSDSYLGYIVCREGDLPLVGRTVIQSPSYIDESTAVAEPVNFFGQKLLTRGVPFMQQDQRFAVCAHVAAWVLHYSAFRRGIQERRHIADLVGMAGPIHPLRPRTSDGLTESQVAQMLNELGFRTAINHTPTVENTFHTLPDIIPIELPPNVLAILGKAGVQHLDQSDPGVIEQLERKFTEYVQYVDESDETVPAINPNNPSVEAIHQLVDYLIRPYIRSGWPIYAGTSTHAFVICGRSWLNGRPVHFIHDDQNGPYLLASSLPAVSRSSLKYQSAYKGTDSREIAPEHDIVEAITNGEPSRSTDARRAIEALVTAVPPRVLLSPSAANRSARVDLSAIRTPDLEQLLSPPEQEALSGILNTKVSIVMGIDYKVQRRNSALGRGDQVGVLAFSSLQLAEWVIVVESIDSDGTCFAELVYDASSSDEEPRIQFSRIFSAAVAVSPLNESHPESAILESSRYPALDIPERVGKVDFTLG